MPQLLQGLRNLSTAELTLRATPSAAKVLMDEDDEIFGHYLAGLAGIDLPATRNLGDIYEFCLTAEQLQRLTGALSDVARGRLDAHLISNLAEEFGLAEEVARGTLKWYAGRVPNRHTRIRLKLDKLVGEASAGKGTLSFIHREE
jgi:hypothetical protein